MRPWIVRVAAARGPGRQQMSPAGNLTLRQYEKSMLPHRPEIGRRESFFSARCKVSRETIGSRTMSSKRSALRTLGSVLGLAAPLLLLAQLLTSCGSDDESKACNPGDLHACTCGSSSVTGSQVCKDDGSGYENCSCDGTATGGGGSGGGGGGSGTGGGAMSTAGSSGMSADAPFPRGVGAPCDSDADCAGSPLVCLTSASSGVLGEGGPANGYCSLPCGSDAECAAVDDVSICNRATGYCYGACLPGAGQAKCRAAQACLSVSDDNSLGACLPRCASDADCGPNRFCDPGIRGICLDAAPAGGKVGDPCTAANQATDCASGFCIEYSNGAGSGCGAFCTLGLLSGCGFDNASGGVRQAFCFEPVFQGGNVLDVGACFPLCDTTADCAQAAAGWVCELFTNQDEITQLGRQGECIPGALSRSGVADAGPG